MRGKRFIKRAHATRNVIWTKPGTSPGNWKKSGTVYETLQYSSKMCCRKWLRGTPLRGWLVRMDWWPSPSSWDHLWKRLLESPNTNCKLHWRVNGDRWSGVPGTITTNGRRHQCVVRFQASSRLPSKVGSDFAFFSTPFLVCTFSTDLVDAG